MNNVLTINIQYNSITFNNFNLTFKAPIYFERKIIKNKKLGRR